MQRLGRNSAVARVLGGACCDEECGHEGFDEVPGRRCRPCRAGGGGPRGRAILPGPGGGYPGGGYPGGGYGQGGVIGSILDSILGGRSYGQHDRYAVEQCVRAVEHRINTRGLDNEGGRYRNYGYGYGYDNRYGGGYMGARVTAVTQVQRRSNGGLKVFGYATTSGQGGYGGYGGGPGYGYGYPGGGYPGGGYGGPGYGGYNSYGYAQGDAQFDCTIDRYGRITDIDAKRNRNYGYRRY